MSMQGGLYYFHPRPIPESEAAAVLRSVGQFPSQPATWEREGVLMAHAGASEAHADTTAITFDGRIDNRSDLELIVGHLIRGVRSDAALAFAVYQRAGCEGLASLIGDWSLVIWDGIQRQLVLASDFAGVKPLYYSASESAIRWSTRLKPLTSSSGDEIDDEYVAGLLMRGACPNRTPYPGVFSIPPGHCLIASARGIDIRPFWKLPFHDSIRYTNESDYEEHLREHFRDAVRCRLNTSAPVLAELSGGLDSSSIACMANRLIRNAEVTAPEFVTLTYEHEGSRDKRFQEVLESFCCFRSVHLSTAEHPFLTESQTEETLPLFWACLHRATAGVADRFGAKTLLTGALGDMVMGNWHDDSAQVLRLFRAGRYAEGLSESLAWSRALQIPIYWVLGRAMLSALPPVPAVRRMSATPESPDLPHSGDDSIAPAFRARVDPAGKDCVSRPRWAEAPPERRAHFRGLIEMLETRRLQPPEPLQHLAYTHPYSHRPLVQYMISVPAKILCGPGEPRRLMRRAFQELWPPELRHRRSKDSFTGVFLNALRPLAGTLLKSQTPLEVVERGYVEPAGLKNRLERMTYSLECNEPQLRQIILLEFWLRGRRMRSEAAA